MPAACRNRRAAQRSCDSLPTLEDALHLGEHEWAAGTVPATSPIQLGDDAAVADALLPQLHHESDRPLLGPVLGEVAVWRPSVAVGGVAVPLPAPGPDTLTARFPAS